MKPVKNSLFEFSVITHQAQAFCEPQTINSQSHNCCLHGIKPVVFNGDLVPLAENVLLTANRNGAVKAGVIRFDHVTDFAERCMRDFDVRCPGPTTRAGSLSGGNLQKFIVGREILQEPGILIVSQPTWGVDVGASMVIRQALLDLRDRGAAIVVISEELDELFEIADSIAVIAQGCLTKAEPVARAERNEIGMAMAGKHFTQELAHAL
jgi:general nucleoside transport system ATP-binding protein